MKNFFSILFFLVAPLYTLAQGSLQGKWVGIISGNQIIQLNLFQQGGQICGFTYDYAYDDHSSFCKVFGSGYFVEKEGQWVFNADRFIENPTGTHISATFYFKDPVVRKKSSHLYVKAYYSTGTEETVLKKVSDVPDAIPDGTNCFSPGALPSTGYIEIYPLIIPRSQKDEDNPVLEIGRPLITYEPTTDSVIRISFFDSGVIDGDSIVLYVNGKALFVNAGLSDKPLTAKIPLQKGENEVQVVMVATKLGEKPPVTSYIDIEYAGIKRSVTLNADLEKSALLLIRTKR